MLNDRKRLARALGVAAASALGVWISGEIWPHWRDSGPTPSEAKKEPGAVAPHVPISMPDKQASMLGTQASLSTKPLKLILVATSPSPRLSDSTATLGTDPRNPQTYSGGAMLSNGARIVEIHSNRIVLSIGHRRSILPIESGAAARAARNSDLARARADPAENSAITIGAVSGREADLARASSSRPDSSEILRPQPVFENGRIAGLELLAGTNSARLVALGLEPGDIVRSVAGSPVETPSAWQELDEALSSGRSVIVGIERKGVHLSVSVDAAQPSGGKPAN
jgi:hypothetical protein